MLTKNCLTLSRDIGVHRYLPALFSLCAGLGAATSSIFSPKMSSPQSPESISNAFSVRIVSIDYYMAQPIPDFGICHSTFHGEADLKNFTCYVLTFTHQMIILHRFGCEGGTRYQDLWIDTCGSEDLSSCSSGMVGHSSYFVCQF